MIPYLFAIVTLLVYWYFHAKELGGLKQWLQEHMLLAAVQVGVMFVVVFFRAVLTPYLAIPFVMGATSAILSGSIMDKVAKLLAWIKGLFSPKPQAE